MAQILPLAVALWLAGAMVAQQPPAIFLGVIEPNPLHETSKVRVAFTFENQEWRAMPGEAGDMDQLAARVHEYPAEVSWTIAFDGREIGKFHGRTPAQWERYADIGLQMPDPSPALSLVRDGASGFSFWTGTPAFRPAVVVSAPNFRDPDRWKPFQPDPERMREWVAAFRRDLGPVAFPCETATRINFPDGLVALEKAYRSASGEELFGMKLNPSAAEKKDCDEMPGEGWESRWYSVQGGKRRPMGRSLELIDAGDYDNDGRSEVVFHKSGYNYDGYVLFYDRLRKQTTFGWSYH